MTVRLVIVSDHNLLRQALTDTLQSRADVDVVGEAATVEDGVTVVARTTPDVLLLDLAPGRAPSWDGVDAVVGAGPGTRVLVLAADASEVLAAEAWSRGCHGFLGKDVSTDDLVEAIESVAAGRRHLGPGLRLSEVIDHLGASKPRARHPLDPLTPRQRQVITLVVDGKSNAQIGAALAISPRTVEVHRREAMVRLGLHGNADLIRFAIEHRLGSA